MRPRLQGGYRSAAQRQRGRMDALALPSALRFTTHEENLDVALHQVYLVWWERRCAEWAWWAVYAARYHRRLMRTAFWLTCNLLYEAAWGEDRSYLEERHMSDVTPGSLFGIPATIVTFRFPLLEV